MGLDKNQPHNTTNNNKLTAEKNCVVPCWIFRLGNKGSRALQGLCGRRRLFLKKMLETRVYRYNIKPIQGQSLGFCQSRIFSRPTPHIIP